jgi:hypothetical protein
MAKREKRDRRIVPTAQHRVKAEMILEQYWLAHVERVARGCLKDQRALVCYPPRPSDVEATAQLLADLETSTDLSLAT